MRTNLLLVPAAVLVVTGLLAPGCAHRGRPGLAMPVPIPQLPAEQSRCRGTSSPLVTEWPASEKANLEALLKRGSVAVEYSGCAMRVLRQCSAGGAYVWQRTSPARDAFEISNNDELYAKLPLGAAALEADLKRHGKLEVATEVAGQLRLQGVSAHHLPTDGDCRYATHLITSLSVGAFTLSTSGGWSAGAGAEVKKVMSAGGKVGQGMKVVRAAGQAEACGQGTEQAPHPNCSSPIQVFLERIPGRGAEEPPPGMVQVELVSADADRRWDVVVDDRLICTTPCVRWMDPTRPLLLQSHVRWRGQGPDELRILRLEPELAAAGNLQLLAVGTDRAKQATGITFASLGGTAMVTGIALTGNGCSQPDKGGMCRGGLITLGASVPVLAGAIWLILDSLPRAEALPIYRAGAATPAPMTLALGPGFVRGTF